MSGPNDTLWIPCACAAGVVWAPVTYASEEIYGGFGQVCPLCGLPLAAEGTGRFIPQEIAAAARVGGIGAAIEIAEQAIDDGGRSAYWLEFLSRVGLMKLP